MPLTTRIATHLTALATALTFAAPALLGPPHIHVREVNQGVTAPAGAVFLIEATHHDQVASLQVVGRAEGIQAGKRVTVPLTLTAMGKGHFAIARQWSAGTSWVLVLTAEQGPDAAHGVAEALVKVDAAGKVVSIDYPAPGWVERTNVPKRTSARDIDAMVAAMNGAR